MEDDKVESQINIICSIFVMVAIISVAPIMSMKTGIKNKRQVNGMVKRGCLVVRADVKKAAFIMDGVKYKLEPREGLMSGELYCPVIVKD